MTMETEETRTTTESGDVEPVEAQSVGDADAAGTAATPAVSIATDPVEEFKCSQCGCIIDVSGLPAFTQVECPDCSTIEAVPARLGNFLLLKLLGMGGMGGVYYAKDTSLGRFVAIKVMLKSLGDDAEFIETFRREAQAVAKLNHPNIAQIYSFGQEKGQPYIVMELVSGDRVDDMLEAQGGLPQTLAMRIALEVAEGLSAADEAGLVHGDIKPENILLDTKGHAKVVDFGLATVAHAAASEGIWGTPYYIAPEKIRRQKVDARADIYSLGATLYHIITGSPPFEGETPVEVVKARIEHPPPDIKETLTNINDKVASVITRMLATERTERYPTYKSLISDLKKVVDELGGASPKSGKHIRIRKKGAAKSPSGETDAGVSKPGGKRKIVIRKDKGAPAISLKRSSAVTSNTGEIATEEPPAPPGPTPEELERKRQKRKKAARKVLITFLVLLTLAAIGGLVAFLVYRKQQITQHRAEWFARLNAQEAAAKFLTQVSGVASNTAKLVIKTEDYDATIHAAILAITGQELVVPMPEPEPEPEEKPEDAAGTNATEIAEGGNNTTDGATEPAADAEPEDSADSDVEDAQSENTKGPADEAEVIEEVAPHEDEPAESAPAEEVPLDEEPTEPVAAVVPDEDLPPIAITGRNTILNLRKLRSMNARIQALVEPASEAYKVARETTSAKVAQSAAADLKKLAEKAVLYADSAKALHDAAKKTYAEVADAKVAFDKEQAAKRQAELDEQKRIEEAARIERERLALEAKAETETERTKLDQAEMKPMFLQHDFNGIMQALEQKRDGYETERGKKAFQVVFDRFKYIADMQTELIAAINADPFRWGWGAGSSARDIEKASEKGISISGSPATIPWKGVSVGQMLKMVDHYLSARSVRATGKITIAMGAAIYCDEFGEKGATKAKAYFNRALDLGLLRADAERLMEVGW